MSLGRFFAYGKIIIGRSAPRLSGGKMSFANLAFFLFEKFQANFSK
jgi:hypothetical protein